MYLALLSDNPASYGMSLVITELARPIVIFRVLQLDSACTSCDVAQELMRTTTQFIEKNRYPMVYQIIDMTHLTADDAAIRRFVAALGQRQPGSLRDLHVTPVASSTGNTAAQFKSALQLTPALPRFPIFSSTAKALDFVTICCDFTL